MFHKKLQSRGTGLNPRLFPRSGQAFSRFEIFNSLIFNTLEIEPLPKIKDSLNSGYVFSQKQLKDAKERHKKHAKICKHFTPFQEAWEHFSGYSLCFDTETILRMFLQKHELTEFEGKSYIPNNSLHNFFDSIKSEHVKLLTPFFKSLVNDNLPHFISEQF